MIHHKGIDHITSLFSIVFISLLSFHLVSVFPKPSHNVAACMLTSCTLAEPSRKQSKQTIAIKPSVNISPAVVTSPTPAYIALIPTLTPTVIPSVKTTETPAPADKIEQSQSPQITLTPTPQPSEQSMPEPTRTPDLITAVVTPVTALVSKTTNILH